MKKYLALAVCVALGGCSSFDWPEIRSLVSFGDEVATSSTEQALEQGREHFAVGNYGIALDSFNAAITFDPQSIKALNGLAASYDKLGRFDLAPRKSSSEKRHVEIWIDTTTYLPAKIRSLEPNGNVAIYRINGYRCHRFCSITEMGSGSQCKLICSCSC